MIKQHAVIWLDHQQAHLIRFDRMHDEKIHIHASVKHQHLHHRANSIGDGRAPADAAFFDRIAAELREVKAILICGPATAKTEFAHYLGERHPAVSRQISKVEAIDHPSDGELLKHARHYFESADRLASG